MWALQMKTDAISGAWAWLNFHYEPWESADSPYFGATLAALAIGQAPEVYADSADIQDNLKLLRTFFQREYDTPATVQQDHGVVGVGFGSKAFCHQSSARRSSTRRWHAARRRRMDDGVTGRVHTRAITAPWTCAATDTRPVS